MTAGYARLSLKSAFHRWRPSRNDFYLEASCKPHGMSLLPRAGAKLKKREELPAGAHICADCARKENAS